MLPAWAEATAESNYKGISRQVVGIQAGTGRPWCRDKMDVRDILENGLNK